jgi:hypothetical protein
MDTMDKRRAIGDFLELGANAFASGLVAAIALAVVTLALASCTQAAPNDAKAETLDGNPPWSAAPTQSRQVEANGVGALWACRAPRAAICI